MSIYRVYKITSINNNKIYFGYTCRTLNARFYGHYYEQRNTIISRSLRKYGIDNFEIELLFEFACENLAKQKEIELIAEFRTNVLKYPDGCGMNMTDGGEGARGFKHSLEQIEAWKIARKGIKRSEESIKKGIDKIVKKVYQFSAKGMLLDTYLSTKHAAKSVGCDPSNISKCCTGRIKTVHGFIFQYDRTFVPRDLSRKVPNTKSLHNHRAKCCYLFDKTRTLIRRYDSVSDVCREFNVPRSTCLAAIKSRSCVFNKDYFLSYCEVLVSCNKKQYTNFIQQIDPGTSHVVATFSNIAEAAESLNIDRSGIDKCLMGKQKMSGGYLWKRCSKKS